jgi:hypothetical protein
MIMNPGPDEYGAASIPFKIHRAFNEMLLWLGSDALDFGELCTHATYLIQLQYSLEGHRIHPHDPQVLNQYVGESPSTRTSRIFSSNAEQFFP